MARRGDRKRRRGALLLAGTAATLALAAPAIAGDGTFAPVPGGGGEIAVGPGPYAPVVADLDGDGHQDLVVANGLNDTVSVTMGDGSGELASPSTVATGSAPYSLAVGDLDEDGDQDVVSGNIGADTVSVLLGNGSGGFGAATSFAVGDIPLSVALADLDGDRHQDLLTANYGAGTVTVRRGTGLGGFAVGSTWATGNGPFAIVVRDLDGDGLLDAATADALGDTVSVLIGNGSGGFAAPVSTGVGLEPRALALADLDGDGHQDLVSSDYASDTLSVLRGDGAGGLTVVASVATGDGPHGVAATDADSDGHVDLIASDSSADTISVLLGDGTGDFGPRTAIGGAGDGTAPPAIADLDEDGNADVVVAGYYSNTLNTLLGGGPSPGAGNLLANPGGEGPGAAGDSVAAPTFPGWTRVSGQPTVVRYGTPGFPTLVDAGLLGGGTNLFIGGPASASSTAAQTVDVSAYAAAIDAGRADATLSALIGGFLAQGDHASLTATHLDGAAQPLGAPLTLGPVTSADRHNLTTLLRRAATGDIPAGTRAIRVTMAMTRVTGADNQGFLDDLSLRVTESAATPATPSDPAPSEPAPPPADAGPADPPARSPAAAVSPLAAVSKDGVAAVALTCPATATAACRGTLAIDIAAPVAGRAAAHQRATITRGGRRINLGKRPFSVPSGRRATVSVRLNRAGRARIASSPRLTARAVTTVRQSDGTRLVRTSRIVLSRGAGW
jgi:hypothetical protein